MLFKPALNSLMLVGRVVVTDQIDFLIGGNGLIDHAQELQPLLMAVFLLTQTEDLAVGDNEQPRRKRRGILKQRELMV